MPPFPFLRSNHDKDPLPPDTSNSQTLTSPPSITSSDKPQFTHPFTSSSTNASTSTVNASSSSPAFLPAVAESPTSKYHPSRLLRRKASLSNKSNETPTFADSDPLPSNNVSSNTSEPPTSPRRLPSSPRGFPSSPRGFFFDNNNNNNHRESIEKDRERDKFATYPTTRRGSDTSRYINYGLPSPTSAKRSAFVYNGKLTSEGEKDQAVVIIPSGNIDRDREEDQLSISNNLAALGIKSDNGSLSSSLPKVLDGGLGSTSGVGIFGKIMNNGNDQPQSPTQYSSVYDNRRPPTPPDSAKTPFYPTALSPPRRPMPKSPRALRNQHQRTSIPTPSHRPETPPSVGMMQALSAVGGSSHDSHNQSPSPSLNRPRRGSEKPRVTAEWLARKPSLTTPSSSSANKAIRHRPPLSVDQSPSSSPSNFPVLRHQASSDSPILPISIPKRQGSLDDSPKIIELATDNEKESTTRRPSFSSDTEGLSSDGEIGLNPRRKSLLTGGNHTPSRSGNRKSSLVPGTGTSGGGFEVIVNCIDNRLREGDDEDGEGEIKWEVTIKKQSSTKSDNIVGSSPVQLSTHGVNAQAPLSASSINLSLSLDQPTGKLVFINFPMDIHATPTRKRRPSTANANARINHIVSSPRPSTPPNQLASKVDLDDTLAQSQNQTPTRTPSSRRKPPPPWPSPRTDRPIPSPPASPRDVFNPKKTPSRVGVNGDLLNKITRGDVSE
ncbi:hypothetical protein I203_107756 [Kwoniella mangroviensis CBS 8507]|uniref:hypothetical protein n=1 Tax=Kwoniella mangroviensis CBS 8507 TaxID=1296122 RepID=UPI00080D844E|nr:uncharacterized protein I203_08225 [Kwoniella mangroviensis CBS 8507]OCF62722.1 hypothetical protein I203_08225 [Kwoniella mangroviensis CBS 8507]